MKTFTHLSTTSLFIMALVACGSGGKTAKPVDPVVITPPPVTKPTPQKYTIKVAVSGLKGAVTLLNGTESLELKTNGSASFSQTVEEGSSYDVSISKQPTDQICSLKNGRKIMVANAASVEISCSDGFAAGLQIIKPKDYSLKDLRVVSNYQSLGGQFDLPLNLSSKLKVYPNSFVSLRSIVGTLERTIYLAYVADKENIVVNLNSESTALALMLLEPAVVNALESHQLTAAALLEKLAPADEKGAKKLLPEMQKLADEVLRQANAGGADLFEFSGDTFGNLLDQALALTLEKISASSALAPIDTAIIPTGGAVVKQMDKADKSGITVTVNNTLARNLAVRWGDSAKDYLLLSQGETAVLDRPLDLTKSYTVKLQLLGAGLMGTLPEDTSVYAANFARSAQRDYFSPSLSVFLGVSNLNGQTAVDCISTANKKLLEDAIVAKFSDIQPDLQGNANYRAYSAAAEVLRNNLPTADYLGDVFKCANLGVSTLTTDEKITAQSHIRTLLEGWNNLRSSTKIKEKADLFNNSQQSNLVNAIAKTPVISEWQHSNAFDLTVNLPEKMVEDELYQFAASCGVKASCKNFTWKFEGGDGVSGQTVKYAFSKFGEQSFSVSATDNSGYSVEKMFKKFIDRNGSVVSVRTKTTNTPLDESSAIDMGSVFSGSTLPYSFAILNSGIKPLVINEIVVAGEGFEVQPFTIKDVAPGKTGTYTILFKPTAVKNYTAKISIKTNDKYAPESSFNVKGAGALPVGDGLYETTINEVVTTQAAKYDVGAPVSEENPYVQVRLFSDQAKPYPQLSLKIANYSGLGRYSLDDDAEQNCHGMLLTSASAAERFCTDTSSSDPVKKYTGSVVVDTVANDPNALRLEYDFEAINSCLFGAPAGCVQKVIRVRGAVTVEKSIMDR